jgi:predicted membrane protein (TIGR00267 family)
MIQYLRERLRLVRTVTGEGPGIARRYLVVNGFDGALTMVGIIAGFYLAPSVDLAVVISACLGGAIALGVSGVASALISESAEQRRSLNELEGAMLTDLSDSAHGWAARLLPPFIALVNGGSPLLIAAIIISPLWLAHRGFPMPLGALETALLVALATLFGLGTYLGHIAGRALWRAGLQTVVIAGVTLALVTLVNAGGP